MMVIMNCLCCVLFHLGIKGSRNLSLNYYFPYFVSENQNFPNFSVGILTKIDNLRRPPPRTDRSDSPLANFA